MKTFALFLAAIAVVAGVWFLRESQVKSPWVPDEFRVEGEGEGVAAVGSQAALETARTDLDDEPAIGAARARRVKEDAASADEPADLNAEPQPALPSGSSMPVPAAPVPGPSPMPAASGEVVSGPSSLSASPLSATPRAQAGTTPFYVQVGAFGENANAERRVGELEKQGFPVFSSTVDTHDGKSATAVRLGPFADRAAAVSAAARYLEVNPGQSTLIGDDHR